MATPFAIEPSLRLGIQTIRFNLRHVEEATPFAIEPSLRLDIRTIRFNLRHVEELKLSPRGVEPETRLATTALNYNLLNQNPRLPLTRLGTILLLTKAWSKTGGAEL
ncbi:hypothetical protein VNO77_23344 [Canavalia gladiata]|uniref:Uncharacterized protein n=1 Tax=Canavalia gladiata TaxID=3824 RepID=A0AAN9QBS7_CANGL